MKRSKGFRNRTRSRLRKSPRERGNPPITHAMREFAQGEHVAIRINSAVHAGMPYPRFQGLTGVIAGKQGRAFLVRLYDGGKEKTVIAGPEHLHRQE